jgi:hypothetical protein
MRRLRLSPLAKSDLADIRQAVGNPATMFHSAELVDAAQNVIGQATY